MPETHIASNQTINSSLVDFNGKDKYSPPEFTYFEEVDPTAIRFLNSDKLGEQYENDMFVGDIVNGNIYHFDLNKKRTELNYCRSIVLFQIGLSVVTKPHPMMK